MHMEGRACHTEAHGSVDVGQCVDAGRSVVSRDSICASNISEKRGRLPVFHALMFLYLLFLDLCN